MPKSISSSITFKNFLSKLFSISKVEVQKLLLGGILLGLVISSYTITKELQSTVFSLIIGAKYIPLAKLATIALLIPAIFLDAILVDHIKRHQILIIYFSTFATLSFIFSFALPFDRLNDPQTSFNNADKCLAFAFYFFTECYVPFLIGLFWSLMNANTNSLEAKNIYAFIVSISKMGGMLSSFCCYLLISSSINMFLLSDEGKIRAILIGSSFCLTFASMILLFFSTQKKYQLYTIINKTAHKEEKTKKTGVLAGIKLLIKQPYVLGIFGLIFFADCINEVINFERILLVTTSTSAHKLSFSEILGSFYMHVFWMHTLGFILSFFVTNFALRFLNIKYCLMIMPIVAISFISFYALTGVPQMIFILYVVMHAMSYSIAYPVRESLYVITSRDIQTKGKFSIDVIAPKSARAFSQSFIFLNNNIITSVFSKGATSGLNNIFLLFMSSMWLATCFKMSKRYQAAVDNDETIS